MKCRNMLPQDGIGLQSCVDPFSPRYKFFKGFFVRSILTITAFYLVCCD